MFPASTWLNATEVPPLESSYHIGIIISDVTYALCTILVHPVIYFLFTMQPYLLTLIVSVKDMFQTVFFIDKILPEIMNDIVAFAVW